MKISRENAMEVVQYILRVVLRPNEANFHYKAASFYYNVIFMYCTVLRTQISSIIHSSTQKVSFSLFKAT